jgi:dTMP kinase
VVLEGGDGAGKSTQLRLLAAALSALELEEIVVTREPGGTSLGQHIRKLVLHGEHVNARAEALLYAADRAQHVAEVVQPALARGAIVLSDRFVDSSIAYQADGRGLPKATIEAVNDVATGGLVPDLTVVLDIPPEVGAARRGGRCDRIEAEGLSFHGAVRRCYLELAARQPARYLIVDATGPQQRVHRVVLDGVVDALGLGSREEVVA